LEIRGWRRWVEVNKHGWRQRLEGGGWWEGWVASKLMAGGSWLEDGAAGWRVARGVGGWRQVAGRRWVVGGK